MLYLVGVGKEWAGPVFPHPLKGKGCLHIHDGVRLILSLVGVGKEWAGPVFLHPDNLDSAEIDTFTSQGGERMGRPSFSPPLTSNFMFYAYSRQGNWRLAEFFPTPINHMHNNFPNVITLCIMLMFNLVRVGKEWAGPVFPPPPEKQRLHLYSWQGKVGWVFLQMINHLHNSFPPPYNLLNKVDV